MTAQATVKQALLDQKKKQQLVDNLPRLEGKRIMIVGDIGLDEYVMGAVRRISPEAPVPVLEVDEEDNRLGLAANVAQNVSSLGGIPMLVSVVGQDLGATMLKELCLKSQVGWDFIVTDTDRPTTRKTRAMTGHHHIVRIDYEVKRYLSPSTEQKLFDIIQNNISKVDALIIEDYAKGVVSQELVKKISSLCQKHGKKVLVDPHLTKTGDFYQGVDLIKPNYSEALALSGLDFDDLRDNPNKIVEAGRALQKKTGAKEIVLTRGKDGMSIFSGSEVTEVPTYARKVFDVTGAGDTVIAAIALGLSAGFNLVEACTLANFAAGVVVGKVGCVPCEIPELKEYILSAHEGL